MDKCTKTRRDPYREIFALSRTKQVSLWVLFILLLGVPGIQATAQQVDSTFNLVVEKQPLKSVFLLIEAKGQISINYDETQVDATIPVSVNLTGVTASQALQAVLRSTNYEFVHRNGTFLIIRRKVDSEKKKETGSVKGRVVDFETSQPLAGASVKLDGTNKATISDEKGYYTISGIKAGEYVLTVTYTGYSPFTELVKINDSQNFDVRMQTGSSNTLGEVIVSSAGRKVTNVTHTTERQIVAELKAAQSVVSGISSEQISKGADRNAAEVVRKIAGVSVRDDKFIIIRGLNERYNLTYLNNNIAPSTELYSRAFSLDLIPSRIIDRILVYKSPAPDLLGDMTGGAIKIFTKDAKNVKHFDVELQVGERPGTTFNKNFLTYHGGKTDFLGFDDGTRKLSLAVPRYGDFTKASISQKTYARTFSPILQYSKAIGTPTIQLTSNYYNSFKLFNKALSALTSFSYKSEPQHLDIDRTQGNASDSVSQGASVVSRVSRESRNTETAQLSLLQNFTYKLRDSSRIYFKNFLLQQGQSTTILKNAKVDQTIIDGQWQDNGAPGTNRELRDIILTYSQRFLYSGNIGGNYYLGKKGDKNLEFNGGYTYSRLDIPDQRVIHLQNNIRNDARFPKSGVYNQQWVPVFRQEEIGEGGYNNLEQGMISRAWIRNTEKVYNGSADYTWKLKSWVTLKAGTYHQWKERQVFRKAYTVNEGDLNSSGFPNNTVNSQIGGFVPDMDFNVVFFHQQDLSKVWSPEYLRDNNTGLKVFDRTSGSDAYTATEQNNSGYIAISLLPFNAKIDIYGGIRAEYNRQKVAGALAPTVSNIGGVNSPILADLKSTEFLPSLNVSYRPTTSLVFRGAYGKTVNRPEFRELSPYSDLDYVNNQTIVGNSNLVGATVHNYDVRMEWYPHANAKGESISLGGFYKQISHPIERITYRDLNFPGPSKISFINADQAEVYGVELDIRKNLDFLPGNFFRNLSLIANGSYIYSKAKRAGTSGYIYDPLFDRELQGQSPYIANAGLYYDNPGTGTKITVTCNQIGPRIYAASVGRPALSPSKGEQGSLLELARRQGDISITQRIIKSLQAKLSIQNVLDDRIQMAEDANFTYKYEKATYITTQTTAGNVPFITKINGDLLATDYKPGRFFLLILTYGF